MFKNIIRTARFYKWR